MSWLLRLGRLDLARRHRRAVRRSILVGAKRCQRLQHRQGGPEGYIQNFAKMVGPDGYVAAIGEVDRLQPFVQRRQASAEKVTAAADYRMFLKEPDSTRLIHEMHQDGITRIFTPGLLVGRSQSILDSGQHIPTLVAFQVPPYPQGILM
jgi:hypothetical protein